MHATILTGNPLVATLTLPASKTDQTALGTARAHPCLCGVGVPRPDCPVHALWDQLLVLRRSFPALHVAGRPSPSLPLFPTLQGTAISKQNFVKTVLEGARRTGQQQQNADATLRLSGHSLRATGAQHLARLGADLLSIQLLGRWGSTAVLSYVRDAAVGPDAARSRSRALGASLQELSAAAAGAQLPAPTAADFEEQVQSWFRRWLGGSTDDLRSSIVSEIVELLRRPTRRRPRSASTSTSTSPSSSSSSRGSAGGAAGAAASEQRGDSPTGRSAEPEKPAANLGGLPAASLPTLTTVSHRVFERIHRVKTGPPEEPHLWISFCSWRFGRSKHACLPEDTHRKCERCILLGGTNWGSAE